jgi:hypothetical protein
MTALEDAQEEVKPDMTPMIDVVFLMIIFFICIDFKVLESKLPAFLPKDKGSQSTVVEPQVQLSVKVRVDSRGTPVYPPGVSPGQLAGNKRPYRFKLENHRVKWEVGPKPLGDIEAVKRELTAIARDPNSQVDDKEKGGKKLMGVVIEPYPGACYEDVAKTTDACRAAGFTDINFGGGLGADPGR